MKIEWFKPTFWGKEELYVIDALKSTWISDGEYIHRFESEFSKLCQAKHTITVNNGTSALHLALLSLDIGPSDEVIVPGYTFAAPANMVKMVGATPVFIDVDVDTWCIDPKLIEAAITKKTKAIIPVHTYGNVCDMKSIMTVAKKHKLSVIEDTAEAAFSLFEDKAAGTFGDVGCFSFQATKTLTMGEGGAIVITDDLLADKARLIRNHGMQGKKRYWHYALGHNFRLTNYQAGLGLAQLEYIQEVARHKDRVMKAYKMRLEGISGLSFQVFQAEVQPLVWSVALVLDKKCFGEVEQVRSALLEKGIETRSGFFPFYDMPIYDAPYLPITDYLSKQIISLPSYTLITEEEIDYVCEHLIALRA
jgi:perosamine synthetase